MFKSMFKVVVAVLLFGLVHSALASTAAKDTAAALLGHETADGLYRPAYIVLSLLMSAALLVYVLRQPSTELYRTSGPLAWLLVLGQTTAAVLSLWAAYHVGLSYLTGWEGLTAWRQGGEVPPMPDGQGPMPQGDGTLLTTGPFAYLRQPLNVFPLFILWLWPRMTTRLLAVNLAVTAYVLVGTFHSEAHLLDHLGEPYRAYQEQVPFPPLYGRRPSAQ